MPVIEIVTELDCPAPTPVRFAAPTGGASGDWVLRHEGSGARHPAQPDGDGVVAMLPKLTPGKHRFQLEQGSAGGRVSLKEESPTEIGIHLPEGHFTTYRFAAETARPYFYPVHGPGGKRVTRDYPMQDIEAEKAAKDQDHPHHRSFWTAYDETNGVNNWAETAGKHGWTRHVRFEAREQGPAFAGFTAFSNWLTPDQAKPFVDERRRIRVYNAGPAHRLLDYDVQLIATYEDVEYGDTKEGGILAWRVFYLMKEAHGGRMENSDGLVGEKLCWGKRASWLDYSGMAQDELQGVAMMDHPGNLNHPCRWHTRAYGLVGANPFATNAFEPQAPKTPFHQKKGTTLNFRYRVMIHRGNAHQAHVDAAYHAWVQPPRVVIT